MIFETYLGLLYTGKIYVKPQDIKNLQEGYDGGEFGDMSRLYILADRLQDDHSKNRVINSLVAFLKNGGALPGWSEVADVYRGTPELSPLRRLLIDAYVAADREAWLPEQAAELPKEFFIELSNELLVRRAPPKEGTVEDWDWTKYNCPETTAK
jgi:hypothetical protein